MFKYSIVVILAVLALTGCSALKPNTKPTPEVKWFFSELCTHSKPHQDIVMMVLNESLEPNSITLHCDCAYGFECSHSKD